MLRTRPLSSVILCLSLGAACSDNAGPGAQPCTAANARLVSLAVAQYATVNPDTNSGCVIVPANTSGAEAEFLIVPQAATGVPGRTLSFVLRGGLEPVAAPPALSADVRAAGELGPADRFHALLRQGEQSGTWGALAPRSGPPGPPASPPLLGPKPTVGELRQFSVCAKLDCSQFDVVGARARVVGEHLAIFIDTLAPSPGLSDADLDSLKTVFDSRLYPIDTAAFGRESDINQDSVVIVLMTNVVNKLVTAAQCQNSGFVAGFFLGADIDPAFRNDQRLNHAEVFYSMVADPNATLSCAHSTSQVKRFVPITFIHEFQHMISYNQHVLMRNSAGEVLWLNEALSHYAEELGGRSYLADLPPDNQKFTDYVIGDLLNAYQFLEDPGSYFVLADTGIGSLAERGAQWLYVRYLVDQYASDTTRAEWDAFTRRLVQTAVTGATNVQAVTGVPFDRSVSRWALTSWVDDLPGFTTPAELTYKSWNFRSVYQQLFSQNPNWCSPPPSCRAYPLVPTSSAGSSVDLSGTLRAGSGVYHRALQAAGAPSFLLTFRASDGFILAPSHDPRLNVIRIR